MDLNVPAPRWGIKCIVRDFKEASTFFAPLRCTCDV